eukprot:CAMPEP_0202694216 /NCGR_PEP_ID=MMETSP1385-20130828/8137_1 /ASSEMBLY_ACC=CAM_ASM_000861 /TAXON_ID=933848 /ORGANISM="Elphidium margaritaceum" /LENGTH=171 /DNA_ID=CAMNT_0049350027 /DNA_START=33 /DNA_END=548 /DNA_ORIENTATION=+
MATRILKEYKECQRNVNKTGEMKLFPTSEKDLFKWTAFIRGPPGTPYHIGVFELSIDIPRQYPMVAPKAVMKTKIFHPNIHHETGEICMDILKSQWSPVWTIEALCRAVIALLDAPDSSSPLNCDAGNVLRANDLKGYYYMALMYAKQYAVQNEHKLPALKSQSNSNLTKS